MKNEHILKQYKKKEEERKLKEKRERIRNRKKARIEDRQDKLVDEAGDMDRFLKDLL
jgi:hypothetical protein